MSPLLLLITLCVSALYGWSAWRLRHAPGAPSTCEGDVEFKYSYTSKTRGYKRKTTTTTWYLEYVKLVAVQTPGVKGSSVDEDPDGDDD